MPPGAESRARAFYVEVLRLREIPKPPPLAVRGEVWFGNDKVQIHLGVEADFRPARKADPALLVDDLDALEVACRVGGFEPVRDTDLPGYARFYVADSFGNRIELLRPQPSGAPLPNECHPDRASGRQTSRSVAA